MIMILTPAEKRISAKLDIIRAFNRYLTDCGFTLTARRDAFANAYNLRALELDKDTYYHIESLTVATLIRWQSVIKKQGVQGLGGNYGKNKGTSIIDTNTDIKGTILAMISAYPHIGCKNIMRKLRIEFTQDALPSYRTLQRWVASWKGSNASLHMAMTNPDKYRSKFKSASGSASENVTYLNQIWEMDSTPADIQLKCGNRYNIVGCIDIYSRRLTLTVSKSSTARAVAGCLRKAILKWGLPTTIKTDNGADYVSRHIAGVIETLQIEQTICPPFSPEKKPHIERVFKTFSHGVLELMPGFVGHNVAERTDIEQRKAFSKRLFEKDTIINPELTAQDLQHFCDDWCENVYHQERHGTLKMSPAKKARDFVGDIYHIENERALDMLLLPPASGGGVRTINKKGLSADGALYMHASMGGYEGKKVKVLLSDEDWGHAYVFDMDGTFICKALCPDRVDVSREDMARHKKQEQAKILKEQKKELNGFKKKYNAKTSGMDILRAKAIEQQDMIEFPKPTQAYSNTHLDELVKAKGDKAIPPTKIKVKSASNVYALPESPVMRYRKWCALEQQFNDGIVLKEFELRWFELYPQSAEYKAQVRMNSQNTLGEKNDTNR